MSSSPEQIADAIARAYRERQLIPPPSSLDPGFDVAAGYAVEAAYLRQRIRAGHQAVGRKVGYANKALWRMHKLDTVAWAHMYDDTVRAYGPGRLSLSIADMTSPKIEPEVVFKLKRPVPEESDAAAVLAATEWLALGFEIIDCVFPDWKYEPADFVASAGLHAALIVGDPRPVLSEDIGVLVGQLSGFQLRLSKDGEQVDEGSGRNSLRSPALCVAELAAGLARQHPHDLLHEGELISSGTLTTSWPIAPGQSWSATVEGLGLAPLELRLT